MVNIPVRTKQCGQRHNLLRFVLNVQNLVRLNGCLGRTCKDIKPYLPNIHSVYCDDTSDRVV
jgi:hypothetical protein